MIFDTHAHYDDEQFQSDKEELLDSLQENGIEAIVNVSSTIQSIKDTIQLMERYPFIYGAVGVHPNETLEMNDQTIDWLRGLTKKEKIVAIGEIGLDYYWDQPDQMIQKKWFALQMELAKEVQLPVIIHSRDAAKDTLDMIFASNIQKVGGVIHCFSYPLDMAKIYLNMGFYLGIGGVITFPNAKKLKEVVAYMPLEQLVLETDCPYLSPVPNRGKRNSSLNLTYIAKEIAQLKKIDYEKVIQVTSENAKKLYHTI